MNQEDRQRSAETDRGLAVSLERNEKRTYLVPTRLPQPNSPMPEALVDPLTPSYYFAVFGSGIPQYQSVGPDLFGPRAPARKPICAARRRESRLPRHESRWYHIAIA